MARRRQTNSDVPQSTRMDLQHLTAKGCVKCGSTSGDDWSQCRGSCPHPESPYHKPQSTRVDCTAEASAPTPTPQEVEEMNAPGELLGDGVETWPERCSRGLHEQAECEPWKCLHCIGLDVNPPDSSKLVLVFCSWLVAERSDSHNWTLKVRRRVEGGANAGKHAWRDVGYYGTPGQAATRALHLMVESEAATTVSGGLHLPYLVKLMVQVEEKLRGTVEQAAAATARARALSEVLAVVKCEEDKRRIQQLMKGADT